MVNEGVGSLLLHTTLWCAGGERLCGALAEKDPTRFYIVPLSELLAVTTPKAFNIPLSQLVFVPTPKALNIKAQRQPAGGGRHAGYAVSSVAYAEGVTQTSCRYAGVTLSA
jgi:hypothetical protein